MIVDIEKVGQAFKRAHGALLDHHELWAGAGHKQIMIRWWQEDYGVGIITDGRWWDQLEFVTEADCTAFLLRWS